jgi:acetyltransferase-like isoleucine patch superfamily enzyme
MIILAKFFEVSFRIIRRLKMYIYKHLFKKIGDRVIFDPYDHFSYRTISIGSDVFIGPGAKFSASESSIFIGDKVMFGPNVTIMGGDHNTSQIGSYMYDVRDKLPDNDLPVRIENDCWIGSNATILKGVVIKKGTIVASGALVTKTFPEYTIIGGVPAKVIKQRFSEQDLLDHKSILGEV